MNRTTRIFRHSTRRYIRGRARTGSSSDQSPCSRQRIRILVSARLHATAAPDAPEPMIRTSTLSCIEMFPVPRPESLLFATLQPPPHRAEHVGIIVGPNPL